MFKLRAQYSDGQVNDIVTDAWYCFSEKTWYKQGFSIIGNVIAWMELPKPYKNLK